MSKIDKHVYLTTEQIKIIENYGSSKNLGFSSSVSDIIDRFWRYENLDQKIDKIENDVITLIKKINILLKLNEQLYSDLEFTKLTDVTKSETLNKFYKLMRRGRLID